MLNNVSVVTKKPDMLARSLNDDHSSQFKKCSKLSTSGQYKVSYLNPLTTNVPNHIETSQLICIANQLTGFYMMGNIGH